MIHNTKYNLIYTGSDRAGMHTECLPCKTHDRHPLFMPAPAKPIYINYTYLMNQVRTLDT